MQVGSSSRLLTICLVTCIDGYEMAKQGRDGKALGIAAIGSFVAGSWTILGSCLR
jgi:putative tricarboxylic transport membrane protein